MKKLFLTACAVFLLISIDLQAEDPGLDSTISTLAGKAAEKYIQPLTSAIGASLNTGWVHRPPEAKMWGVDFEINAVATGALLSGGDKSFSSPTSFQLTPQQARYLLEQDPGWNDYPAIVQSLMIAEITKTVVDVTISGPTVIGNNDDTIFVAYTGNNPIIQGYTSQLQGKRLALATKASPLDGQSAMPFVMPQINIGTVYGTQVAFRYFPTVALNNEIGKIGFWGLGLTHNPAIWLDDSAYLPLDLTTGFYYQQLKLGDLLESHTAQFAIYGSKTFGYTFFSVTPYAGISYESFSTTIKYDFELFTPNSATADPNDGTISMQEIKVDLTGDNSFRLILGSSFKLGIFNLNLDYNLAKYSTVSAGLGIVF